MRKAGAAWALFGAVVVVLVAAVGAAAADTQAIACDSTLDTLTCPVAQATVTSTTTTTAATATVTTTVAAPPANAMPVGDLPGWHQIVAQDFNTPAALGQFGAVYGTDWRGYSNFQDTSKHGTYTPDKVLSVSGGLLDMFIHTENGVHMVATPLPNGYRGQLYGRYALRFRSDSMPGYKMANLLWSARDVWSDGEVDFPENGLGSNIAGYTHDVNGSPQNNVYSLTTSISTQQWHVAATEWTPGQLRFYVDGVQVGATTNGVPFNPMRWVPQFETQLGTAPADTVSGHVQIDWMTQYTRAP